MSKSRAEVGRRGDFDQFARAESANEPARALVACEAASPPRTSLAREARDCRAGPRCEGAAASASLLRQEGVDQRVDQPRLDPRHVAEQHNRALDVGRQGGKADPERGGEAARKRRIEGDLDVEARERGLDRAPRVADDDDDRTRASTRAPFPPTIRTIGLPSSFATSFVASEPPAARKRADCPAASTTAPTLVNGNARLRARGDLHEEPADAHRADVRVADRHAGQHALQDPVEAVLLRRPRATRRADDRGPAALGEEQADCRDRPACRTARCALQSPRSRLE